MARLNEVQQATEQDEESATVIIYQKNGEPYRGADGAPAQMSVLGSESKAYRTARDRLTQRTIANRSQRTTPQMLRANRIELAAAVVTGWSGWEDEAGEPLPPTRENIREVLGAADHVLEQVEAGIAGHADFFENSSRSSSKS